MNREQMINKLRKYCFGECETCIFRNVKCDFKVLPTETLKLYIKLADLQNKPTQTRKIIKIKYFDKEIETLKNIIQIKDNQINAYAREIVYLDNKIKFLNAVISNLKGDDYESCRND